ncbi:MAG: FtsX-like permease family protein [Bacteroidetes bacterium]|jgi:lipoprotein-releasing system permease protein|nr:FtsX-like permease family protein [Bacteroidota bacterium]MBT6687075.1 FtsX-like permease family protein [Bacteroidota bacterium]MBT7142822.1 FtsX-like permease family protein [Bacteroidota bacterium]MBT7492647.1 FtsX-like permease family protein [Bacteroidota bacterium]
MYFPLYIAKRYLISKKSTNIINIISAVSVAGISITTISLIVILSVFNGLEDLIKSMFSAFDPDLKITIAEGKTFDSENAVFEKIKKMEGIVHFSEIIEGNALLKYGDKEEFASIKGVGNQFSEMTGIDSMMIDGKFLLKHGENSLAVVGYGIARKLSLGLSFTNPIVVYVPKRSKTPRLNLNDATKKSYIFPSGIFSIQQEIDSKYIVVPIEFAENLYDYKNEITGIELKIESGIDKDLLQKRIEEILGDKFVVKNRYQQQELIYKTIKSEKLMAFVILTFILLIASFNVVGSLTMLVIDKKHDIATLRNLGANLKTIKRIFLLEGWLISILGAIFGLFLGGVICYIQIKFGLIELYSGESMITHAYPVKIIFQDFTYTFITVVAIGFMAAWYPVRYITRRYLFEKL